MEPTHLTENIEQTGVLALNNKSSDARMVGVECIIPILNVNYSWAYEMRIEDPDGHVLRFGSEPKQPK